MCENPWAREWRDHPRQRQRTCMKVMNKHISNKGLTVAMNKNFIMYSFVGTLRFILAYKKPFVAISLPLHAYAPYTSLNAIPS